MKAGRFLPRAVLGGAIATAIALALAYRDQLDAASFEAWLSGIGVLVPLAYLALYTVGTVVFLPGMVFALAGGALFGPVWGAFLNLVGTTVGASFAFLIGRYLAGDWVARRTGGRLGRLIEGVETEGWRFVAFVRLVPLIPFNLTNYALGLTRIRFVAYVIASFICMAPGAIAYTWLGHAGREAMAGDASAVRYGILALGLLTAIAFAPRLVRLLRTVPHQQGIEPDTLARSLIAGEVTVVDVREPEEFIGPLGHIQGSLNLPLGALANRINEINAFRNKSIVLVCRTDKRSATAAKFLNSSGFGDVRVLRGGMERWKAISFRAAGIDDPLAETSASEGAFQHLPKPEGRET